MVVFLDDQRSVNFEFSGIDASILHSFTFFEKLDDEKDAIGKAIQ